MTRISRIVAVNVPHHITQRGNRRQIVFFRDSDYHAYLDFLAEWCAKAGLAVWAYCLMPNQVHIVAVPTTTNSLCVALGETHRHYSSPVNLQEGWRGYLWQGRFAPFPMDEWYTYYTLRYVEANLVRAKLVTKPEDWPRSSAAIRYGCHHEQRPSFPLVALPRGYHATLATPVPGTVGSVFQTNERTGRPLGNGDFIDKFELLCNRVIKPKKIAYVRQKRRNNWQCVPDIGKRDSYTSDLSNVKWKPITPILSVGKKMSDNGSPLDTGTKDRMGAVCSDMSPKWGGAKVSL